MDDKAFREQLEQLIQNDDLRGIKTLFGNVPQNFNINYRNPKYHDRCDTPLMQCLKYGADIKIFKFLENKGAKIGKSISSKAANIDGQRVPFSLDSEGKISFDSGRIIDYTKNVENIDLIKKYENAHKILDYIDKKSDTAQKDKISLVCLSAYYLDKKLLTELVEDRDININVLAGRGANLATITLYDTVRKDLIDIVLRREELEIDSGSITQAAMFEDYNIFAKLLERAES
ncbi:MAG: hypothetical protein ACRYE9_03570 [Janthinobacterium lividum]